MAQSGTDESEWFAPRWCRRLGRLAELGAERDPVRIRQRLLENLDTLTDACLCRSRTYHTKDGSEYEVPDPDLKTALGAQLAGARMLGVDGAVEVKVDTAELDELMGRAKRALAKQFGRRPVEKDEEPNASH